MGRLYLWILVCEVFLEVMNVGVKDVFRTQSNICDGAFMQNWLTVFLNYFCKKTPSKMFEWVLRTPLRVIFPPLLSVDLRDIFSNNETDKAVINGKTGKFYLVSLVPFVSSSLCLSCSYDCKN